MNEKELKDLQLFGNTIEKPVKKIEKSNNIIFIKPNKNKSNNITVCDIKKNTCKIIYNISKKFILYITAFTKKIFTTIQIFYIRIKNKKKLSYNHKNKKTYRLVETCKKRKNKTIIIRKRISVPYYNPVIYPKKSDIGTIYYVSLKDNDKVQQKTKTEAYTKLKDSLWDFRV